MNDSANVPAPEDQVLEQPGQKLRIRGVVEGHYRGGAVVQFPTVYGGAMGVPTGLKGLKVGEPATLEATVLEATREVIRVTFQTPGGEGQTAELARLRCTIE